jgi:multidrug efflux pump subunit AcrB
MMQRFTKKLLSSPKLQLFFISIMLLLFVLSIISLWPLEIVNVKVLPPKDARTLSIYIDLQKGTSLKQTQEHVKCIHKILEQEKEVLDVETYFGMGAPTDITGLIKSSALRSGEESAQMVVNLTKPSERDQASFVIAKNIRTKIAKNCNFSSETFVVEEPAGPPVIGAVVLEIYGKEQNEREKIAQEIKEIFKEAKGLVDIDIQRQEPYEKYFIKIDKQKALRLGISIEQINKIVYLAFEGMEVAYKNQEDLNDQIPLYLTLDDASKKMDKSDKEAIKEKLGQLKLMNPKGVMVNLLELIEIKKGQTTPPIYSKNLNDYTIISAETDLLSPIYPTQRVISLIKKKMADRFEIEHGDWFKKEKGKIFDLHLKDKKSGQKYLLSWEGEVQVSYDMGIDLAMVLGISVLLIMTLLIFYYQSIYLPNIILFGSFFALIGIVAGHMLLDAVSTHQVYFTGTSLIGAIALIGISARNSILLIDSAKNMIREGISQEEAIIRSTAIRTRPILLTAIGVMLGSSLLIPDSVFGGLGISLTFGIVTATIASLVLVPIAINLRKLEV